VSVVSVVVPVGFPEARDTSVVVRADYPGGQPWFAEGRSPAWPRSPSLTLSIVSVSGHCRRSRSASCRRSSAASPPRPGLTTLVSQQTGLDRARALHRRLVARPNGIQPHHREPRRRSRSRQPAPGPPRGCRSLER